MPFRVVDMRAHESPFGARSKASRTTVDKHIGGMDGTRLTRMVVLSFVCGDGSCCLREVSEMVREAAGRAYKIKLPFSQVLTTCHEKGLFSVAGLVLTSAGRSQRRNCCSIREGVMTITLHKSDYHLLKRKVGKVKVDGETVEVSVDLRGLDGVQVADLCQTVSHLNDVVGRTWFIVSETDGGDCEWPGVNDDEIFLPVGVEVEHRSAECPSVFHGTFQEFGKSHALNLLDEVGKLYLRTCGFHPSLQHQNQNRCPASELKLHLVVATGVFVQGNVAKLFRGMAYHRC